MILNSKEVIWHPDFLILIYLIVVTFQNHVRFYFYPLVKMLQLIEFVTPSYGWATHFSFEGERICSSVKVSHSYLTLQVPESPSGPIALSPCSLEPWSPARSAPNPSGFGKVGGGVCCESPPLREPCTFAGLSLGAFALCLSGSCPFVLPPKMWHHSWSHCSRCGLASPESSGGPSRPSPCGPGSLQVHCFLGSIRSVLS